MSQQLTRTIKIIFLISFFCLLASFILSSMPLGFPVGGLTVIKDAETVFIRECRCFTWADFITQFLGLLGFLLFLLALVLMIVNSIKRKKSQRETEGGSTQ